MSHELCVLPRQLWIHSSALLTCEETLIDSRPLSPSHFSWKFHSLHLPLAVSMVRLHLKYKSISLLPSWGPFLTDSIKLHYYYCYCFNLTSLWTTIRFFLSLSLPLRHVIRMQQNHHTPPLAFSVILQPPLSRFLSFSFSFSPTNGSLEGKSSNWSMSRPFFQATGPHWNWTKGWQCNNSSTVNFCNFSPLLFTRRSLNIERGREWERELTDTRVTLFAWYFSYPSHTEPFAH